MRVLGKSLPCNNIKYVLLLLKSYALTDSIKLYRLAPPV